MVRSAAYLLMDGETGVVNVVHGAYSMIVSYFMICKPVSYVDV